jgi:hypothetical protein
MSLILMGGIERMPRACAVRDPSTICKLRPGISKAAVTPKGHAQTVPKIAGTSISP